MIDSRPADMPEWFVIEPKVTTSLHLIRIGVLSCRGYFFVDGIYQDCWVDFPLDSASLDLYNLLDPKLYSFDADLVTLAGSFGLEVHHVG